MAASKLISVAFTKTKAGVTTYIHKLGDIGQMISTGTHTSATVNYEYTHRDQLGSIVATTGKTLTTAADIKRQSNGAWGERRFQQWNGPQDNALIPQTSARGFTDHEHMDAVGLIHMNGRVYDPELGRFLSADPIIQSPYNTQSYNRYSYVFNNPLSFTDPSGFTSSGGSGYQDYGFNNNNYDSGGGIDCSKNPDLCHYATPPSGLTGEAAWLYFLQTGRDYLFPNTVYMGRYGTEGSWWDSTKGFLNGGYNLLISASPGTAPFTAYLEAEITPEQASGAALFEIGSYAIGGLGFLKGFGKQGSTSGTKGASGELTTKAGNKYHGNSTGSSASGGSPRAPMHPQTQQALDNVKNPSRTHGHCCEIDSINKALNAGDDVRKAKMGPVSLNESGRILPACSTCREVMKFFDIE